LFTSSRAGTRDATSAGSGALEEVGEEAGVELGGMTFIDCYFVGLEDVDETADEGDDFGFLMGVQEGGETGAKEL